MLAAQVAVDAIKNNDFSEKITAEFQSLFENSWAYEELRRSRNFRQVFNKGIILGLLRNTFADIFKGRDLFGDKVETIPGHLRLKQISQVEKPQEGIKFDDKLTFSKLSDVFYSKTIHPEDQQCHLVVTDTSICVNRCSKEYGNPCQYFCPAAVYEIRESEGQQKLFINFSNCVHCKTCDIMDPYQIINWVVPEEGGPTYYLT
jgi:electron-transferring-flavoprotein dehydrogenase